MTVPVYQKKADGKRNYHKLDYCYYCEKKVPSKSSKHLLSRHTDREGVKEIIRSESRQERKRLLYKLQQLGNYQHNTQVFSRFREIIDINNKWQRLISTHSIQFIVFAYLNFSIKSITQHNNLEFPPLV